MKPVAIAPGTMSSRRRLVSNNCRDASRLSTHCSTVAARSRQQSTVPRSAFGIRPGHTFAITAQAAAHPMQWFYYWKLIIDTIDPPL